MHTPNLRKIAKDLGSTPRAGHFDTQDLKDAKALLE
jgi:hypothetical protein